MKARVKKFMVIMLSLMMIASSFISVSFAEDAPEDSPKAESTETVKESKPEPAKAKPPAPEPVKEKAPEPEPAKESAPEPEPVVEQKSDNGGGAAKVSENNNDVPQEDQTPQEELSVDEEEPVIDPGVDQSAAEEEKKEEEEKMPAQSFSGSAGGLNVKASVGKGVFPKDTKMKVSAASSSRVIAAAQGLTGDNSEVVDAAAADITFYHDGKEVQPKGSVNVSLRPTSAVDGDTFKMIHISDGGSANVVAGASAGGGSASVSSFSIYGIIGEVYDENTVINARYTYNFYVGNELVDSQTVINGENLNQPATPNVNEGKFEGWRIEGESGLLDFSQAVSIPADAKKDKVFKVDAVIAETFYATFWRDTEMTKVLKTKEGVAGSTITTGDVTWKFTDGTGIVGWKLKGVQTDSFTINENVDLLPIISNDVCTVTFETGEGTPIPTVFVEKGKTVTKPANPNRSGYSFEGWFTDSACTAAFDFKESVNEDLILHAKWEGAKTTYKVVHWKQNANDDGYTFVEMSTVKGNAGANATYTAKTYTGFTLNAAKTNINTVIKGDGTTIKNVYYDRNKYKINFYTEDKNKKWSVKKSYDFKYEENTATAWNEIATRYSGYLWYTSKNGDVCWSSAPSMPLGGIDTFGRPGDGSSDIYYYEFVNGKRTTEQVKPKFTVNRIGWKFTDEDYIEIPGFKYAKVKDEPKWYTIFGNATGQKNPGKLYYTRNNYAMQFITNGGADVVGGNRISGIAFEQNLANYKPSNYNEGVTKKTENGVTYTFTGWYTDETLQQKFNFNSKMPALEVVLQGSDKSTLVLFAGWTAKTHTVSFDLDGGTFNGNSSIASEEVESGKLATAPDSSLMVKTGFVFGGWIDGSGKRFSFDTRITKDCNLKAIWNSDKTKLLSVEYDVNGGAGTITDGNMYQDGAYAVIKGQPAAPEGKYFAGWKIADSNLVLVSGSFQVKAEEAESNVVKLTAQYADKPKYSTSVIYVLNGGNINGNTSNIVDENAVINGKYTVGNYEPAKDDCTFIGWSTNLNGTGGIFSSGKKVAAGKDGNILYAQWKDNPKTGVKVIITGKSDKTKVYNGEEHSVEGVDYDFVAASSDGGEIPEGAVSVTLKSDKKAIASGTDVNTYKMGLSEDDFDFEIAEGYAVAEVIIIDGELEISPCPITVEIRGNTNTFLENDQEQSVSGYVAEAVGSEPPSSFDIKRVSWQGGKTPVAKGTEPNTYPMGLDEKDFSYPDNNFKVTFKLVQDGLLTITAKTRVRVIITGARSEDKVYTGELQSIEGFKCSLEEVAADGPVIPILRTFKSSAKAPIPEDAVSVTLKPGSSAKASGIDAGTYTMNLSPNDFVITPKKEYKVVGEPTIIDGKMTINPFKLTVAVKGNEKTVPHNGEEQFVEGFTAEAQGNPPQSLNIDAVINAIKYNGEAKATGTDVGSYDMVLDANKFSNDNKNFEITYKVTNGKLNIEKTIIEEIDPPVDPGDNGEVLPDYRDDRASKKGIRTADISSSEGSSGVNTADSSKLIFYVKILGIAAAILLIVLITRIESRKDNE